jgi:hypothetical protein
MILLDTRIAADSGALLYQSIGRMLRHGIQYTDEYTLSGLGEGLSVLSVLLLLFQLTPGINRQLAAK